MEVLTEPALTQAELQNRFAAQIKSRLPHLRNDRAGDMVVNATPLVDITSVITECARTEFGVELQEKNGKVCCVKLVTSLDCRRGLGTVWFCQP